MRTDHASASARIAFWAASLAPAARISTPMILPPQMTCRVLVLMARNYSATAPDVQSTTPRDDVGSVALRLGQVSRRSAGKVAWNRGNREASSHVRVTTTVEGEMALHFSRVGPATEELEIWSAIERGFSFVISNESRDGPGLHGKPGFVASWRPSILTSLRSGWADHPSRRSLKPRRPVRPCWRT